MFPYVPVNFYYDDLFHWLSAYVRGQYVSTPTPSEDHEDHIRGAFEHRMNMYLGLGVRLNDSSPCLISVNKTLLHALLSDHSHTPGQSTYVDPNLQHPIVPAFVLAYLKKHNFSSKISCLSRVEIERSGRPFTWWSLCPASVLKDRAAYDGHAVRELPTEIHSDIDFDDYVALQVAYLFEHMLHIRRRGRSDIHLLRWLAGQDPEVDLSLRRNQYLPLSMFRVFQMSDTIDKLLKMYQEAGVSSQTIKEILQVLLAKLDFREPKAMARGDASWNNLMRVGAMSKWFIKYFDIKGVPECVADGLALFGVRSSSPSQFSKTVDGSDIGCQRRLYLSDVADAESLLRRGFPAVVMERFQADISVDMFLPERTPAEFVSQQTQTEGVSFLQTRGRELRNRHHKSGEMRAGPVPVEWIRQYRRNQVNSCKRSASGFESDKFHYDPRLPKRRRLNSMQEPEQTPEQENTRQVDTGSSEMLMQQRGQSNVLQMIQYDMRQQTIAYTLSALTFFGAFALFIMYMLNLWLDMTYDIAEPYIRDAWRYMMVSVYLGGHGHGQFPDNPIGISFLQLRRSDQARRGVVMAYENDNQDAVADFDPSSFSEQPVIDAGHDLTANEFLESRRQARLQIEEVVTQGQFIFDLEQRVKSLAAQEFIQCTLPWLVQLWGVLVLMILSCVAPMEGNMSVHNFLWPRIGCGIWLFVFALQMYTVFFTPATLSFDLHKARCHLAYRSALTGVKSSLSVTKHRRLFAMTKLDNKFLNKYFGEICWGVFGVWVGYLYRKHYVQARMLTYNPSVQPADVSNLSGVSFLELRSDTSSRPTVSDDAQIDVSSSPADVCQVFKESPWKMIKILTWFLLPVAVHELNDAALESGFETVSAPGLYAVNVFIFVTFVFSFAFSVLCGGISEIKSSSRIESMLTSLYVGLAISLHPFMLLREQTYTHKPSLATDSSLALECLQHAPCMNANVRLQSFRIMFESIYKSGYCTCLGLLLNEGLQSKPFLQNMRSVTDRISVDANMYFKEALLVFVAVYFAGSWSTPVYIRGAGEWRASTHMCLASDKRVAHAAALWAISFACINCAVSICIAFGNYVRSRDVGFISHLGDEKVRSAAFSLLCLVGSVAFLFNGSDCPKFFGHQLNLTVTGFAVSLGASTIRSRIAITRSIVPLCFHLLRRLAPQISPRNHLGLLPEEHTAIRGIAQQFPGGIAQQFLCQEDAAGSSQVSGVSFLQLDMSAESPDHHDDPPLQHAAEQDDSTELFLHYHRGSFIFSADGLPTREQLTIITRWVGGKQSHARPLPRARLHANPPLPRARYREGSGLARLGLARFRNIDEVLPSQSADPISVSAPLPREDTQDESAQLRDGSSFLQLEMFAGSTDNHHDPQLPHAAEEDDGIELFLHRHRGFYCFLGYGLPTREQLTAINRWVHGMQSHARPSVLRSRLCTNPPLSRARFREAFGLLPPQANAPEIHQQIHQQNVFHGYILLMGPNPSADPISASAPPPRGDIRDENTQLREGSSFLQLSRAGECGCCATRESTFGFQLVGNPEADSVGDLSKPCNHRDGHHNIEDTKNESPCASRSPNASNDALRVVERSHWDLFLIVAMAGAIAIPKSRELSGKWMAIPTLVVVWAFGLWAGKMTQALQASWRKWMIPEGDNQSRLDSEDEVRIMKKSPTRRNLQQFLDEAQKEDVDHSDDDFVSVHSGSGDEIDAADTIVKDSLKLERYLAFKAKGQAAIGAPRLRRVRFSECNMERVRPRSEEAQGGSHAFNPSPWSSSQFSVVPGWISPLTLEPNEYPSSQREWTQ